MRVAIIPARGGSQRIPGKNIKPFHGKPIVAYSIETAVESKLFDRVFVSTESKEIMEVATEAGAEILTRPEHLAENQIGTQQVIGSALFDLSFAGVKPDAACCIYATAPMLETGDLATAMALLAQSGAKFAFAVGTEPLRDAGMFYWGRTEAFLCNEPLVASHSLMVPIPEDRVCDINTPEDWLRAETMYETLKAGKA